ncbi:MAG TPA: phosphoenolpyruvate--protein phosphotransferase [Kofleriaceae bacterium]|nr:phosphoenolpyruvate--protein phosphotransferase [Kofleriaceae bacterium]
MNPVVLVAPLAGRVVLLDEVPDPAFAQGMIGDGVAIDPAAGTAPYELCAPCDGTVVTVHRARHACTLRADNGAEILLHIGVDTVELRGEGFRVLVADGQRVRAGDPLIRVDRAVVARKARSLVTPVVLVGGDGLAVVERAAGRAVAAGAFLMAVGPAGSTRPVSSAPPAGAAATATHRARLTIRHGLHARPAAVLVHRAQQHAGAITVACGARSANARSLSALLALGVQAGDELAITATGPGAETTAAEIAALVAAGLGEAPEGQGIAVAPRATASSTRADSAESSRRAAEAPPPFAAGTEVVLQGIAGAAGLSVGRAVQLPSIDAGGAGALDAPRDGAGVEVERGRLARALAAVRSELEQTIAAALARGDAQATGIFGAHLDLLADPELAAAADQAIAAGRSAAWAWRAALGDLAAVLRRSGNPLLAERTADLADLDRRALAWLGGHAGRVPAGLPDGAVLVADELLPSELAAVPAGRLAGLCTMRGGATSHVAILAAGLGVPAVVALGDAARRVPDGAPVIVDGDRGRLQVFPAATTRDATERAIAGRAVRRRTAVAAAHLPALTAEGTPIAVHANLGAPGDAAAATAAGADGCGLLRTEFLFHGRPDAPGEDEQAACYQAIADRLRGRPLVIRTLDAGGDKPLDYLPQPREDNPALGVRGIRLALRHPALLRAQLRAVLRVRPAGACQIMVPMVATLAELRTVRAMLDAERAALGAPPVALGAMIEVPAAALAAGALAREAEFFSIGTNDLAQYALAIDRGNPELAAGLDPLHPGVLRLIASTASAAYPLRRPVAVCGGAAGDPCAVPILLGLGVRSLSVAPAAVPEIKAIVRTLSLARCAEVAAAALELDAGDDVRALVVNTWPGLSAHLD